MRKNCAFLKIHDQIRWNYFYLLFFQLFTNLIYRFNLVYKDFFWKRGPIKYTKLIFILVFRFETKFNQFVRACFKRDILPWICILLVKCLLFHFKIWKVNLKSFNTNFAFFSLTGAKAAKLLWGFGLSFSLNRCYLFYAHNFRSEGSREYLRLNFTNVSLKYNSQFWLLEDLERGENQQIRRKNF